MRTYIIHSILLFCFVTYISALPTGAPTCEPSAAKMLAVPNTPMGKQNNKLAYTIKTGKTFTPGKALTITTSNIPYNGFFLTFTNAKGKHVGEIDLGKNTALLRYVDGCNGDPKSAVTHTTPAKKNALTLTWTPPKTLGAKDVITVKAIYVQNAKAGFQFLTSQLTSTGGGAPPTNTTTTPPAKATTSAAKATTSATKATTSANATPSGGNYDQTGSGAAGTSTPTDTAANTATNAAVTNTNTSPSSNGMSISQYSSFGALVLANAAAVAILL